MKCESCGEEIRVLKAEMLEFQGMYDFHGIEIYVPFPVQECEDGVYIDVTKDFTGYNNTDVYKYIRCPKCGKFPFKNREIEVRDVVRLVMFAEK